MTNKFSYADFAKSLGGVILTSLAFTNLQAGTTALGTEPFTSSTKINALPNVMFVLDDSGSMENDYLPDWAGPYKDLSNAIAIPTHQFFNSSFNGVAYNPATRYRPPVMYSNTGALDTSTYPSQNGQSVAQGGDATATTLSPNWRAVKKDGYGIQFNTTANLEGNAFSYTTTAGEYCTNAQLRTCTASSVPTGAYTFPAKLRWCTTSVRAAGTTAYSNGHCQASNIADTATNVANGVTPYTFPRIAAPRTAVITVNASTTITGITVDGLQILSGEATGGSTSLLATDIASKINACTFRIPAPIPPSLGCGVVGYSAVSSGSVVTVTAPGTTSATPVVASGSVTVGAFSAVGVPGGALLSVITPSVTTYAYPGTAAKGVNRTDCAGTTCTYAEEMTNYANWYAYYRTRMQMMKSASSIAFSNVDDKFRVGFYSINNGLNGAGSYFINPSAFDGAQKFAWYSKFFSAVPYGATPLRSGLANAGRLYAGKLSTLNSVAVVDPIQYSCQQNFTILSTDGYWNDASLPTQINGSTPIGNHDGTDPRPYYDGSTQTRTVSQTTRSDYQIGYNASLLEQRTQQQQTSSRQLDKGVTTTVTYPYTETLTKLQRQTVRLDKSENYLESRTYPLKADTRQLEERIFQIEQSVRPLLRYTYNLQEVTTPMRSVVTNITKTVYPLEQIEEKITNTVYSLQKRERFLSSRTTPVQSKVDLITKTVFPLQSTTTKITVRTYPLQKSTYKLESSTRQLQKRELYSTNGGDRWFDTGWVNASSCAVTAAEAITVVSPSYWTKNTTCQYAAPVFASGLSACSTVTATGFNVAQTVSCTYESTPTIENVASCNVVSAGSSSPYSPRVACAYSTTASSTTPTQTSCTARDQTAASSMTGDKVVCTYDASGTSAPVGSCTRTLTNTAALPKVDCGYSLTSNTPQTGQSSCTALDQSGSNPTTWSGDKAVCAYENTSTFADAPSGCTSRELADFSNTRIQCRWGTAGSWTAYNLTACAPNTNMASGSQVECALQPTGTGGANYADVTVTPATCSRRTNAGNTRSEIACRYNSTAKSTTLNLTSCTPLDQSAANPTTWTGDKSVCAYTAPVGGYGAVASCTPRDPGTAYNNSRITCRYGTPSPSTSGNTTCSANNQATTSAMSGDRVVCAWDPTPTRTTATSCTWNVPASPSATKTECEYVTPGSITGTNLTTCTPIAQSTGTANGTVWVGPAKACTYLQPTTSASLTTCSPTGTNNGTTAYTTCGYGAAVVTPNLNSCVVDPPEAGPSYTGGSTTACAYQSTYTSTNQASCTPVARSGSFAAPEKQCVYAAAVTTTVTSCTNSAVSGGAPYAGPAVNCYYDTTASATNLTATACNANRQTASPFTGPAVDCTYNATAVPTTNVNSCTVQAQSAGPNYVGPAVSCAYSLRPWVDATGTCTVVPQSASSPFAGPAQNCAYSGAVTTNKVGAPCTDAESTSSPYSILTKRVCTLGDVSETTGPVTSVVDNCSTDPTSATNTSTLIRTETATTCAYRTASVSDTPTCTPVAASGASPYTTAVTCPVSDTGWVAVAPSCTPIGALGTSGPPAIPPTFDVVDGNAVGCRTTDMTTYSVDYPSGPVPVTSCSAGTNTTTKVQTTCTVMLDTTAPVASCSANAAASPSFIRTTCNPTTTNTTIMGCAPSSPTSPLFQTVTCVDNGDGTSNTLADVAAYYYKTDLRTFELNNCVGVVVPPATVGNTLCPATATTPTATAADLLNNVPTTAGDPNSAQHMTTFTLGLGASGYMQYSGTYITDSAGDFTTVKGVSPYGPANGIAADPTNGVCSWQATGNCNWPFPASNEQTTIDDLWHAGVNGHGAYFSATDPVSLSKGLSAAFDGIAAAGGAAAAPSVSTPNLSPSDNYVFSSTYTTSDWTGELVRKQIDPFTGAVSATNDWAVQAKLNTKASRSIYTFDSSVATTKLKAFTSANFGTNSYFTSPHISTSPTGLTQFLCASTDICLSATDQDTTHAAGPNLVDYLRGVRTWEGAEKDNTKYYRQRQHILGDLVNASVAYVTKPLYDYADPGYATFVTNQASRQAVAYAGANDGMLHAFAAKGSAATEALVDAAASASAQSSLDPTNASLLTAANTAIAAANTAIASDTVVGQELWAYIPSMVLPNMYKLADKKYKDKHQYFVDGTPIVGDICTADCTLATAVWKTILVGGLGRGGRGYYALDITDPANPKALWEFTDTNLGYTYGNPQIAKLSNGTWVVLITSGYNNIPNSDGAGGDGVGRLYVLNAATGAQISGVSPISTGVGSAGTPSGLGAITAQVANPVSDNTIEAVYGGDLLGNLWRFDVNNTIGATGYDAQLLATLKDGSNNPQPITTKPEVGLIEGFKVVFVGTGRYLAASDASDTSQQSLYAIKDVRSATSIPANAIFDNPGGSPRLTGTSTEGFVRQIQSDTTCSTRNAAVGICTAGSTVLTSTRNPVIFASDNGWFVDFTHTSERANTDPALALGLLAVNTNAPSLLACDVGGKSYSYFLDYLTGGPIRSPGNGDPADGNNGIVGKSLANELASAPRLAVTKSGKLIILTGLSGGGINVGIPPLPSPATVTRRTSWRELIRGN